MNSCISNKMLVKRSSAQRFICGRFTLPKMVIKKALLLLTLSLSFNSNAVAQLCEDLFAHAAQTNSSNGEIRFNFNAQLIDNPSSVLNTDSVRLNNGSSLASCDTTACTASGEGTSNREIVFPDNFFGSTNYNVSFAQNGQIGADGKGDYRDITLNSSASVVFSDQVSEYRIRRLFAGFNSRIDLAPGDYWIDQLQLNNRVQINVIGSGTARLFVNSSVQFRNQNSINYIEGSSEQLPQKLFVYSSGQIQLSNQAIAVGSLYSNDAILIGSSAKVIGAVNGGDITLNSRSNIEFDSALIEQTEFSSFCQSTGGGFDFDGDGIPDDQDSDRDGDGVENDQDVFPDDGNESSDIDEDGIGDNADEDRDGDGFSNDVEDQAGSNPNDASDVPADLDGDNIPDVIDEDRDGDGVDNDQDAFPDDVNESSDLDNDGVGDNADTDRDGDGFSNETE